MKKYTYLFTGIIILCFNLPSFAQMQIGNSDFENFDELGNAEERPVNWNNMMNGDLCSLCSFGATQTTWRDTDTRPGSVGDYSVRVESSSAFGNIVNGNVTLGKLNAPSTTPAEGYNQTMRNDTQFSEVMTDQPDSIVFWAKYSITNTNDSARVSAIIHDEFDVRDPQDGNSESHIFAAAKKNFQTNGNWMRMSFPFDYSGPATSPEYILVTFTSSHVPGSGVDGATLWIDDLELIYNDNEVDISPVAAQTLDLNESGDVLTANETPNVASSVTSRQWKVSNTSGGPYTDLAGETALTYTPQFANVETYYVVCETDFSGDVVVSNEVEIQVEDYLGLSDNSEIAVNVYAKSQAVVVDFSDIEMNGASIVITDAKGRRLVEQNVNSNSLNTIPVNVSSGVYFYQISNGVFFEQGKLFIE